MAGAFSVSEVAKNIPIDFSSVESLPESHLWSNICSDVVDWSAAVSVPVVDLQDPNAMETIKLACEEWGTFQLKNHGIPLSLLKEVGDEIRRLFSLPTEQKAKALRPPNGKHGYGSASITAFFSKAMWHEGFTITNSCYENAKKVLSEIDSAHFCETMEEFQKQLKMVAEKVTSVILELWGVRDEVEKWVKSNNHAIQLNSYPSCPDPDRAMGLAPHKDTSMFTFLHQTQVEAKTMSEVRTENQTRGLQIFKEGIGWVPIHLDPNVLVVNVGDVLEILSNGRFKSVLHRATVSGTTHRYSCAYFHSPSPEVVISPFDSPPCFQALTMGKYSALKAKDPQNALASISI